MSEHETSLDALDPTEVDRRSELARCIAPSTFPATRDEIVASLPLDTPDWARGELAGLPEADSYENFEQVWEAIGGERF